MIFKLFEFLRLFIMDTFLLELSQIEKIGSIEKLTIPQEN